DARMRQVAQHRTQQVRVEARRMDAEPVEVVAGEPRNLVCRGLVVARRAPAAADDNEPAAALHLAMDERGKFLDESDVDPLLGRDERSAERDDGRGVVLWHKKINDRR